jgi:hypothetical protein
MGVLVCLLAFVCVGRARVMLCVVCCVFPPRLCDCTDSRCSHLD